VYSDNDYLFIRRQILPEYLKKHDDNLRKLDTDALIKIYRRLADKARKSTPANDWGFIRSHNVRKYFNSALLNAGADSFFTNFMMGHTLDETQAAYFRAKPEELKEIYIKFAPFITIQKEADVSESPEYLRIKQENHILQAETARHVVERSELRDMRAELEKIKVKETREQNIGTDLKDYLLDNPELFDMLVKKLKEEMIK
jgi:hypothetical protein